MAANKRAPSKITSRTDFEKIKNAGRSVSASSWVLARYCQNNSAKLRVGWTVPTYVGTAVTRNRVKRWTRQLVSIGCQENLALPIDINIVFKNKGLKFYRELSHEIFDATVKKTLSAVFDQKR